MQRQLPTKRKVLEEKNLQIRIVSPDMFWPVWYVGVSQ